ncbi:MAG: hypothetical protein M1369_02990 [Deinococcus sp.]|nr:hypothetical protein [Deinococcus sp.]
MILHQPYGSDDPYRPRPAERFRRDPEPGEPVQINFQTGLEVGKAWVEFRDEHIQAAPLGDGWWTVWLGPLPPGTYTYRIIAGVEEAGPFALEVGCWHQAERVAEIQVEDQGVRVDLTSTGGKTATLAFTIPLPGVLRAELTVGGAVFLQGLPCRIEQTSDALHLRAQDLEVHLDLVTLELQVQTPKGSGEYRGSARFRWLELADGRVTRLQGGFSPQPHEALYGLGERFVGPELRGRRLDVRVYEEYKEQGERTYLPVPFVVSSVGYGFWLDAEEPSHFDLNGFPYTFTLEKLPATEVSLSLCILVSDEPYGVTALFTRLTGEISVPPKWAFGPWMSANMWNSQAKAEEAVRRTLEEAVPATVLVLEAWSDETTFYIFNDAKYTPKGGGETFDLEDFTFTGRWPDPKRFFDECHQNGLRVLLWQIPVLKQAGEPHPQHDADVTYALEQGFCIRNADVTPYRNQGWWFTDSLILDFTNPEAREWWFAKRRYLFDLGIDGFKTDGGEHLWGRDLRAYDGRRGLALFNAYPNLYVGAYHEFVQEATKGDGLTFSRSGYTGAQKYPAHWAGDENSTWAAFKASILAGLSAGLSGISIWGWDIGGFSGEVPTVELYLRSTAMACFCPVMQYHSELHWAADNRDRTPWNIAERHQDKKALEVYRHYAKLRMRLQDYIHWEAQALGAVGLPLMRYPALAFPEAHGFLKEDPFAYLFGRDLLVAPVVEKSVVTRQVRLPPGDWVYLWSGAMFQGLQILTVPAPLERVPVFVAAGSPQLKTLLEAAQGWEG